MLGADRDRAGGGLDVELLASENRAQPSTTRTLRASGGRRRRSTAGRRCRPSRRRSSAKSSCGRCIEMPRRLPPPRRRCRRTRRRHGSAPSTGCSREEAGAAERRPRPGRCRGRAGRRGSRRHSRPGRRRRPAACSEMSVMAQASMNSIAGVSEQRLDALDEGGRVPAVDDAVIEEEDRFIILRIAIWRRAARPAARRCG